MSVPSFNVIKTIAPCPRMDITRPEIHFISPDFSSLAKESIVSCKESSFLDSAGYGFTPFFLRVSAFILASLISSLKTFYLSASGEFKTRL